jgi:hypothetical protein
VDMFPRTSDQNRNIMEQVKKHLLSQNKQEIEQLVRLPEEASASHILSDGVQNRNRSIA